MRPTRLAAAAGIALALSAPALAQTKPPPTPSPKPMTEAAGSAPAEHMKPDRLRASKLIGKTVHAADGTDVGDVADLILDRRGTVEQIVVAVGGVLGPGDKRIAVPMDAVKWGREGRLVVAMSRDEVEGQAAFDYGEPPPARIGASMPPRGRMASGSSSPAPLRSP